MSGESSAGAVLLLGATGRTGSRVLAQLLERGVPVRAIVRSAARLPAGAAAHPLLTVVEGELTSMSPEALRAHVAGRRTVISCLGHTISLRGILGPPRDLVEQTVRKVGAAVEVLRPATPVRLILMSSVSVHRPARADSRRGALERAYMRALCAFLPPARDNQRAADYLATEVGVEAGAGSRFLEWVVVRPDSLIEGDTTAYLVEEGLVASLFAPATSRMANVAHFMAELATDDAAWRRWRGTMPVVFDDPVRPRERLPQTARAQSEPARTERARTEPAGVGGRCASWSLCS